VGTSKSASTPTGGAWTPLKSEVSRNLSGGTNPEPKKLVAGVISAFGGLTPSPYASRGGSSGSGGGSGGGASATSSTASRSSSRVGSAVANLSGFGQAVSGGGLAAGLASLGLSSLEGKTCAEVIGRVAEHIASTSTGQERELIQNSLNECILDAAALQGDVSYEQLDESITGFLAENGVTGLVELFLSNMAYNIVWYGIENHIDLKAHSADTVTSIQSSIRETCTQSIAAVMKSAAVNNFSNTKDWFGKDGVEAATQIASLVERNLMGDAP
jgi:hypothetical protein